MFRGTRTNSCQNDDIITRHVAIVNSTVSSGGNGEQRKLYLIYYHDESFDPKSVSEAQTGS